MEKEEGGGAWLSFWRCAVPSGTAELVGAPGPWAVDPEMGFGFIWLRAGVRLAARLAARLSSLTQNWQPHHLQWPPASTPSTRPRQHSLTPWPTILLQKVGSTLDRTALMSISKQTTKNLKVVVGCCSRSSSKWYPSNRALPKLSKHHSLPSPPPPPHLLESCNSSKACLGKP